MGAPAMEAPRLWHWNDVSLPPQQAQEKPCSVELLDDVRFGSKADMGLSLIDVRFTPKSGHRSARWQCPLCANSGLMHCSKERRYSITSSAVASNLSGMLSPSALAVLRLMISSNFVGTCTGRSAGFSPLRTRSIYPAARRNCSLRTSP
jgi:hypothetical protein